MGPWEYRFTRYHLKDYAKEEKQISGTAFYCDNQGQCFLHDTSQETVDLVRDALNEEGKNGWELVQFGYHRGDVMCIWKRALD